MGQLLGITQRSIVVKFDNSKQKYSTRKLIPVNAKTLGDYLLLKRIEANLTQPELAQMAGVSTRIVRTWEHGHVCPTEPHWQTLVQLLGLDSQFANGSNPATE
jgi:DNA-binding transcriptional regulator YiaG